MDTLHEIYIEDLPTGSPVHELRISKPSLNHPISAIPDSVGATDTHPTLIRSYTHRTLIAYRYYYLSIDLAISYYL